MPNEVTSCPERRSPARMAGRVRVPRRRSVISACAFLLGAFLVASCASAWEQAGFTQTEAAHWQSIIIIAPEEAKRWKDKGFTPEEASSWSRFGLDEAAKWKEGGFKLNEAEWWRWQGKYSAEEAVTWKKAGFDMSSANAMKAKGVSVQAASQMKKAGIADREMEEWVKAGFSPDEAVAWRSAGFSASASVPLKQQGLNPESARKAIKEQEDAGTKEVEALSGKETTSGRCTGERSSELQGVLQGFKAIVDEGTLRDMIGSWVYWYPEYVLGAASPKGRTFKFNVGAGGSYHLLLFAYSDISFRLANKGGMSFANPSDWENSAGMILRTRVALGTPGPYLRDSRVFPARGFEEFNLTATGSGCFLGAFVYRP